MSMEDLKIRNSISSDNARQKAIFLLKIKASINALSSNSNKLYEKEKPILDKFLKIGVCDLVTSLPSKDKKTSTVHLENGINL